MEELDDMIALCLINFQCAGTEACRWKDQLIVKSQSFFLLVPAKSDTRDFPLCISINRGTSKVVPFVSCMLLLALQLNITTVSFGYCHDTTKVTLV